MTKLFISYRREDSIDITGRIYDRLAVHFGRDSVFLDVDTIPFGIDFRNHLRESVEQCDILLAVIGDGWLNSCHDKGSKKGKRRLDDPADFVRIEIEAALSRNIPVIPVLVGNAEMPDESDLPQSLSDLVYRNAAELRSGREFDDHIRRLIRGLEFLADDGSVNPTPVVHDSAGGSGLKKETAMAPAENSDVSLDSEATEEQSGARRMSTKEILAAARTEGGKPRTEKSQRRSVSSPMPLPKKKQRDHRPSRPFEDNASKAAGKELDQLRGRLTNKEFYCSSEQMRDLRKKMQKIEQTGFDSSTSIGRTCLDLLVYLGKESFLTYERVVGVFDGINDLQLIEKESSGQPNRFDQIRIDLIRKRSEDSSSYSNDEVYNQLYDELDRLEQKCSAAGGLSVLDGKRLDYIGDIPNEFYLNHRDIEHTFADFEWQESGTAPDESGRDVSSHFEVYKNSIGIEFVRIPEGSFLMGSPDWDRDAREEEKPQRKVTITRPFYLGVYPVTFCEFRKVTKKVKLELVVLPRNEQMWEKGRDRQPVHCIHWLDAVKFCNCVSQFEGLDPYYEIIGHSEVVVRGGCGYRLPTEAEWEYACRAGTTTKWCCGNSALHNLRRFAWHHDSTDSGMQDVGQLQPNAWGLYDMHGNVDEWCWDNMGYRYYQESPSVDPTGPSSDLRSSHVSRGGSWARTPGGTRSASRSWICEWVKSKPNDAAASSGLRLARNLD